MDLSSAITEKTTGAILITNVIQRKRWSCISDILRKKPRIV